ncbi:MAG: hypothetical protein ACYSU0_05485 [Planctomycetota bacterium]
MGENGEGARDAVQYVPSQEDLRRCDVCYEKLEGGGGVCHHCGKLLCDWRSGIYWHMNAPEYSLEFTGKAGGSAFAKLGLVKIPQHTGIARLNPRAKHCLKHFHSLTSHMKLILIGGGLLILGIGLGIALGSGYPLLASLLGAVILVPGVLMHTRDFIRPQHKLNGAPLNPDRLDVHVVESIAGNFVVSKESFVERSEYLTDVAGHGKIAVLVDFDEPEREALDDFAKRERRDVSRMDWHLGYFSLDNARNVTFEGEAPGVGNVMPLIVKAGSDRDKIEDLVKREEKQPLVSLSYEIDIAGGIRKAAVPDDTPAPRGFVPFVRFPIHIVPRLDASGRNFGLALTAIGFNPYGVGQVSCRITLTIPPDLNVDKVGETDLMTGRYDPAQGQVTWRGERGEKEVWPPTVDVNVGFRENILSNRSDHPVLEGSYELVLDKVNLSGIEVDQDCLFLPTGACRTHTVLDKRTTIAGKISVDLSVLTFQQEHASSESIDLGHLIPDHHTMHRLSEVLRSKDVYVAKTTDNPPTIDAKSANIRNRSWDQIARIYAGQAALFGVDVHSVLSGREEYVGATVPSKGEGKLEITVRGMVHDDTTLGAVEAIRTDICEAAKDGFRGFEHPLVSASQVAAAAEAAVSQAADTTGQREKLVARLEKLEDALLDGKITDERYEKMKADLEGKLSGLDA